MSGSNVEHVSAFVDGNPPPFRRLSSSSTNDDCFYDALSNGSHDPSLTLPSSPPISSRPGSPYTTQSGFSNPQPLTLPTAVTPAVTPNGYTNGYYQRSSPDPDDYYRPHQPTSFPEIDSGPGPERASLSGTTTNFAAETRPVHTCQRVSSVPAHLPEASEVILGPYRSVSDTSTRTEPGFASAAPAQTSNVRSRQTSFKDLINKFNTNVDQVLPRPSASHEQAGAPSPVDVPPIRSRASSRRRDTSSSASHRQSSVSRWNSARLPAQDSPSHFAPPVFQTADLNPKLRKDLTPSNSAPRRRLFGELLRVDTGLHVSGYGIPSHLRRRGSEGSIPSPNPAFLDHLDPSSHPTPLTPTAWYLGRTPFLEAVSTGENLNHHRRTRSDIPGNSPVGADTHPSDSHMAVSSPLQLGSQTYLESPHSKSRIPIASRRLNSPSASEDSSPSPKAESPFARFYTQTPLPPKGLSRLPKPSPKSPRDVVGHGQSAFLPTSPNSTPATSTAPRGRREMSYGRPHNKLADKSHLLEAYIAAPPPKKSPPLRSSRPRQPVSHTTSPSSRSRVGETVSNFQRQINRDREPRSSRLRDRRLPELGNVDFATRRQKIQQAFNRTVKENERKQEHAAELRRREAEALANQREKSPSPEPEMLEHQPVQDQLPPQADDTATVIEESADICEDETPTNEGIYGPPQLHLDTQNLTDTTGASHPITMDSPTLGRPNIVVQEEEFGLKSSDTPPASTVTSCSNESPVTTFDPEPQLEISRQDLHTSHRTLLSEIMRIRESSPSSSSCDEQEYSFSDNDDKETIPIVLRDKLGYDDLMHSTVRPGPQDLYRELNQTNGDLSNRWSMSSWSSSLRNQHSLDGQCQGSGDDLSQLRRTPDDSELVTHSCSASSSSPSITNNHISNPIPGECAVDSEPKAEDGTQRKAYGHSKTPSLAKLGGWDTKRVTQLYMEELARGRDYSLPIQDIRASPEPRPPRSDIDLRADGRTDSLTDDPVFVSKIDDFAMSDRLAHTASLVLQDDWKHASPSIMDWMQVAAEDPSGQLDAQCEDGPQNDGAPTPRLLTTSPQVPYPEGVNEGLGLAINIQSPRDSESQEPGVLLLPPHERLSLPGDMQEEDSDMVQESIEPIPGAHGLQPLGNPFTAATFAPLKTVPSIGSSEDSLRRLGPSPSLRAVDSSATSLVPSSLEQPRTTTSSPSPDQRRLKKRRHVIKELVDTEYTFGRDMKVVDDIYKGTSSSCLDLSPEDVKVLFANSDQVVQFSMAFQDVLKDAAKSVYVMPKSQRWSSKRNRQNLHPPQNDPESPDGGLTASEKDNATFIGEAFLTHMAYMEKVYAEYLKNHDAANKKLQALQRSPKVAIWLKECRDWASDLTTAWDLDSLLVKPVQRILKYPLLLSELLDSTPGDHPDHGSLAKALEEVTNISVRINEMKRRADLVGQVVGRKRKDSDVRTGLSKAFGRRTEKLRQQVGMSDMVADKEYDALSQRFSDNFCQLQVVMRDADMYTRETQGSMDRFLEFVNAIEAFIDVAQSNYPELEGKWRVFKISVEDIMAATLPEHLDVVRKSVINPMITLIKLYDGPQRVMKKRDKRLMDYARFKSIKEKGDKPDKKTAEQGEQFVALNETLKDELPKLYSLTAKLMEACLKNFVQIQTTWYSLLQRKLGPLIDSFPEDVQKIMDDWTSRFNFSEAQVLTLGICNGSLLADTVNLVNFNTPSTGVGVSSPRRPSTVHSSSTRAVEDSPKISHDFSISNQSFQSPSFDSQSHISLGRNRADSTLSGRPAPDTPELPRSQILQQITGASSGSIAPSHSLPESFPRLPRLSLDSPFLADVIRSSTNGGTGDEENPSSPSGRYSGFFSSAMPMSDSPPENAPAANSATKEPAVLFLAASIYEFNIDRARREAGYPYLTYVAGEIFDVIAEKGELWLARNQDDPTHQVVTRGDLQSLKDDWLTDNVISFWEEYLEREFLAQYKTSNIVLLRPSMSFMIFQNPNPPSLREVLPDFTLTTHVFLPINDCRNVTEAEGDGIAFHYDSLPPGNYWEAQTVTKKFSHLLGRPIRYLHLEDSPVQENGSDCGVFVCLSMRHLLLKRLLTANSNEKVSMSLGGRKVDARSGRKEIAKIIEGFRKEGERRRSASSSPLGKKPRSPPRIE
ncbi:hypothetical protein ARAM_003226 [Aspergillus rambellii]|uniref:Dynamin-binding protein n=1 Tax=Aspergillus rambellii TaxID=308745 RepID=A0A0F8UCX9_9EURO|nr:hypothetical protein ARAM_003226 [Aspergillus rambellii]